MRNKRRVLWYSIGLISGLLLLSQCQVGKGKGADNNDRVKFDTIYVTKTITVPEIREVFVDSTPDPVVVIKADQGLVDDYLALQDENERLQKYIEAITKRFYEQTYTTEDSLVTVTVRDSVTGTLDFQNVDFTVREQEIEYQEKTVIQTIEKYPDFILSAGAGVKAPMQPDGTFSFEAALRARTKKGWNYEVGLDTNKELRLTLTKDIFVKH